MLSGYDDLFFIYSLYKNLEIASLINLEQERMNFGNENIINQDIELKYLL